MIIGAFILLLLLAIWLAVKLGGVRKSTPKRERSDSGGAVSRTSTPQDDDSRSGISSGPIAGGGSFGGGGASGSWGDGTGDGGDGGGD